MTPIEYWNQIRPQGISMEEIHNLAQSMHIQKAKYWPICIGQGILEIQEKKESTFYVVVESEDLIEIRLAIQKLLIEKGADSSGFDPWNYYPHITIGFTQRDLHESDGVIKNVDSCIYQLELSF